MITQRKILLDWPIEMVVMGNLSVLKLLQFSRPSVACTLNILSNQAQFRILKHAMNLFPSVIRERNELRQAWKSREIGEEPSPTCFDSRVSPNPIMNILIWNCRGIMKPTFRKTVMDLVEWHQLVIFVIRETRINGPRMDEIIKRLLYDELIPRNPLVMLAGFGSYGDPILFPWTF